MPDVREMLRHFLEDEGYVVSTAADGGQALQQLRDGLRPGVIVSDLHMPEMDGKEFCQALSEIPAMAAVPVVLISAEPRLPEVAASVGARYLCKPIDLWKLRRLVRATA